LSGAWDMDSGQESILEMSAYLSDVVDERQSRPSDDLIGRLVAASQHDGDEEPLAALEITMFVILLLVAGNETTTNLVGNGCAAMVQHPDVARQLRAERPWYQR
jgi:cytochrome P450